MMSKSWQLNLRSCIAAALVLTCLSPARSSASPSRALREYKEGKYEEALKEYEKLLEKKKDDPRLHFNAGTAAYRSKKFDEAQKQFSDALNSADLQMLQKAYYNRGNTLYHLGAENSDPEKRQKDWEEALRDFESTLRLNQQDADAKNNYEFVKKQLEQLKQQQQQQQQSKDNKPDQNQKQDQNQQNQQAKNDQNKNQEQNKEQQNQQQQQQQKDQQAKNEKKQQKNQEQKKQQEQASNQSKDEKEKQKQQADEQKQQQQQANASKDKEKSKEQGEQQQAYAVGQMTPQQAQQLLDAQKNDEMLLPVKPEGKPRDTSKPLKDW